MTASERVTTAAAETAGERLAGRRPSRPRALLAASAAGIGLAVLVYRLLRAEPV